MGFPQESINRAEEIAGKYRLRSRRKIDHASYLYSGKFLHVGYGYDEALATANAGPHLHEMVKNATCFAYGGALYLIAKSLRLNPTLWKARGMKDVEDGENPDNRGKADHTFITCDLNTKGERMLDPHYGLWGKVKKDSPRNRWHIFKKNPDKRVTRSFDSIEPMTEEEFLAELEYHRTPEGSREVLAATQKVHSHNDHMVQITYDPDRRTLRCRKNFGAETYREEPYLSGMVHDLVRPVRKDGSYRPNAGKLVFTECKNVGWGVLENARVPLEYPYGQAKRLWGAWQVLFSRAGKVKDITRFSSHKIREGLWDIGLRSDLSYTPEARLLAEESGVLSVLEGSRRTTAKITTDYLARVPQDELSQKLLLDHAHYLASCKGEGPYPYAYSTEDHEALFKRAFDERRESFMRMVDRAQLTLAISGRLEPGDPHQAERDLQAAINAENAIATHANSMAKDRKKRRPQDFATGADLTLWRDDHDIDAMSLSELERGITTKMLRSTVADLLYRRLLTACCWNKVLEVRRYTKGIERVLKE